MLVLERRAGELIIIGDNIEVHVLSIRGKFVKIGVAAPAAVTVHRREVYERIRQGLAPPIKKP